VQIISNLIDFFAVSKWKVSPLGSIHRADQEMHINHLLHQGRGNILQAEDKKSSLYRIKKIQRIDPSDPSFLHVYHAEEHLPGEVHREYELRV
jgi:hypothetical protein